MSSKEDVHPLVDELPDDEFPAAQRLLKSLLTKEHDPLIQHLMRAPIDDASYTPEEQAEDEEGWQEYLRGEGRGWENVRDAPLDDEPTTSEEDAGATEARQELKRGEGRPLKEVRTELLKLS